MARGEQVAGRKARKAGYARSRDTRARILEAALAEASVAGFHRTSLARIAVRAGVAIGNLHYHFGSRQELLRELMGRLIQDLLSRLYVALPDDDADFFERERAVMRVYLEYLRANPAYVRLADEIKLLEPELYQKVIAAWVERYVERMKIEIERGNLRAMDESEMVIHAHFLLGARQFLDQLMEGTESRPYPGDDAVIDAFLALVRGGLRRV